MIVHRGSTEVFAKKEAGGKGYNLYLLTQAGLPIPEWTIVGKKYFLDFKNSDNLNPKINELIEKFISNSITGNECEQQILTLIEKTPLPKTVENAVVESLNIIGKETIISVRSSAADEDSLSHSFAGQLSSFLYVKGKEDILKFIKLCWASAYSARSLAYRLKNNIPFDTVAVAVVLQKMIDPEKSGVLFTADPIQKKADQFIVSSVYGVGEGLVSGALDADSFWLSQANGEVLNQEVVEKNEQMRRSNSGHTQLLPVSEKLVHLPSLDLIELKELWSVGRRIHEWYNRAQDIEWAFSDGRLWILQSRPITSLDKDLSGYPNLWDNSNIIESYGGLTSPLSFSFALRNYKAVYIQFCEVLGLSSDIIKDMDYYLGNMLGSLNGRIYYNLFNWYKLVGILPGFKQNREFMETMMGVSEALTPEITDRIKSHPSWDTAKGKFRKFITGLNFIRYHFTIQSVVNSFLKTFNKDYDYYRKLPLSRLRGDQLFRIYQEIERNMLGRWTAPIINDFLCMIHFGLLKKLTSKWLLDLDSTLQNNLLTGEGGLESAEPTRELLRLAWLAEKNPELSNLILTSKPEDSLEILNQSEHQSFYLEILHYLDRFGFRCMNEMKLEEIDLNTDPSYLFLVLQNYLRAGDVKLHNDAKEKELRLEAEKAAKAHLSWVQKIVYFWVLKHARKAVKNRENTRFSRTRIYGVARSIFRYIGEDLAAQGILENKRDIFWLHIDEVFGIYNGTLACQNLKAFVDIRKKEYQSYNEETDPRIMTRGPVYWNNKFIDEEALASTQHLSDGNLKGLPCCPGEIEGIVKVIINPGDDLSLNGEILVTARTDPGWVPLYPSISGLLVERGSLLSHSAIVAREMGIPAIVSIPNLTKTLKSGMRIRMDGKTGIIKILAE